MSKQRLDQLLVELGLADSLRKAQALIMSGDVLVDDSPVDKSGAMIPLAAAVRLRQQPSLYVGRGGEKIVGAIEHFQLKLKDIIAIDVGASTGGFTDCLLQRGAKQVYAVDVGYNQLALKLRTDSRVVVMERTHVLDLRVEQFDPRPELAVVDLSFIGLRRVLPAVSALLCGGKQILALVKPQFELASEFVEKGGVVKSLEHQLEAVKLVEQSVSELGFKSLGMVPSALKGEKKGNQEYFVYLVPAGS